MKNSSQRDSTKERNKGQTRTDSQPKCIKEPASPTYHLAAHHLEHFGWCRWPRQRCPSSRVSRWSRADLTGGASPCAETWTCSSATRNSPHSTDSSTGCCSFCARRVSSSSLGTARSGEAKLSRILASVRRIKVGAADTTSQCYGGSARSFLFVLSVCCLFYNSIVGSGPDCQHYIRAEIGRSATDNLFLQ